MAWGGDVCQVSDVGQDDGAPRTQSWCIVVCLRLWKVLPRWWFFHQKPGLHPSHEHMQDCWEAWYSTDNSVVDKWHVCRGRMRCIADQFASPRDGEKIQCWSNVGAISIADWRRWIVIGRWEISSEEWRRCIFVLVSLFVSQYLDVSIFVNSQSS